MPNIWDDYIAGASSLESFYAGWPSAIRISPIGHVERLSPLISEINAYQARIGGTARMEGDEPIVITGQQPAVLLGPLYSVYKAITTIKLAERMTQESGRRVVPVYWVGSDDHDFEEARTAHVLTKGHEPLSLTYEPATPFDGRSMYRVPIESSLHSIVDRAADETPGAEWRDEVRSFLHESLDASDSLADWSARLLARLVVDTPMIVFSPHLPGAKAAGRDVLARELESPLATSQLVNETGARLAELGYGLQLEKRSNECSFFLEVDSIRRKVVYDGANFHLPELNRSYSGAELQGLLDEEPSRFSSNVALRCIVQHRLFEPLAYVAGPGEVAYWAQFKPVFERFGFEMPIVYPRAQCTLTTMKLNKLMSKLGLDLPELSAGADALVEKVLERGPQQESIQKFRRHRAAMTELAATTGSESAPEALAAQFRERIDSDLDWFERRLLRSDKAAVDTAQQQLNRVCAALAPWRKPQERVYSVFSFLFEHGWDLIPRLIRELDIESFRMNVVEL